MCSRLESPVPFLCRSAASLSVDPLEFEQATVVKRKDTKLKRIMTVNNNIVLFGN